MILLNKIKHDDKLFQVCLDENHNRIIFEIKIDDNSKPYHVYPELKDLIEITRKYFVIEPVSYNKFSSDKNNDRGKMIKIFQKVLVAGVAISIALSVPATVKSYIAEVDSSPYNQIFYTSSRISTTEELNKVFDTQTITKDDVHDAIDKNKNLEQDDKNLIHEFVNDVYKKRPEQNWWAFYQNIQRMKINYESYLPGCDGRFWHNNSQIDLLDSLDQKSKRRVLRHELIHALSIIVINIDGYRVEIDFYNNKSDFGKRTLEMLTCIFNSHISEYNDLSYDDERKIFQPLIDELGVEGITDELFNGDINTFIQLCKPYYKNIDEFIAYFETLFCSIRSNEKEKINIDDVLLLNFNNTAIDFYLNVRLNQLKNGTITYQDYIIDKDNYKNNLIALINDTAYRNNIEVILNQSDQTELYSKKEKHIFDENTINNLKAAYDNHNYDLFWRFYFNEDYSSLTDFSLYDADYDKYIIKAHYIYNPEDYDIKDFYFIIEKTEYDNKPKLRLVNKKSIEHPLIDIITGQEIGINSNILFVVPMGNYINSIQIDELYEKCYYFEKNHINFTNDFFSVKNIINFAIESNEINKPTINTQK